jgi:hypothetical protein
MKSIAASNVSMRCVMSRNDWEKLVASAAKLIGKRIDKRLSNQDAGCRSIIPGDNLF